MLRDSTYIKGKVQIKSLYLFITYWCSLVCEKLCMCGDRQNKFLQEDVIDRVLAEVVAIDNLVLGGGEPFLSPRLIDYLIDSLIKNQKIIYAFTGVTNLTVCDDYLRRILASLDKLKDYMSTNHLSPVSQNKPSILFAVSDDSHHREAREKAHLDANFQNNLRLFMSTPYFSCTMQDDYLQRNGISDSGYARKSNIGTKPIKHVKPLVYIDDLFNGLDGYSIRPTPRRLILTIDDIAISPEGKLLPSADSSHIDLESRSFGSIMEEPMVELVRKNLENGRFQVERNYLPQVEMLTSGEIIDAARREMHR